MRSININFNAVKCEPEFWKYLVENSLAAVFVIDENLNFKYINKIVEEFTKYSREELYRMNALDLAYPDDVEYVVKAMQRVFSGEQVFMEHRYVTKDGKVRWVWGFVTPAKHAGEKVAIGNWIDVTKVKSLEQKLKESEMFYRTLIEGSLTPVYIIQRGRLVYVNKAFEEMTGFSKEEALNLNPFDFIHPDDKEEVLRRYLEREKGQRKTETYSWRIIKRDGEIRWVTARPSRILYKGKPAVAATMIDTTELHRLNEELIRKNEYLSLINKILRHDIVNDLAVIRAALELRDEKLIERAMAKIDRIVQVIRGTKALDEAGRQRLKIVDLADVVREIAETFEEEAEIVLNLRGVYVLANDALKSVIHNILQNSIVHSGKPKVGIEISTYANGMWGVVRVADDGIGIPDEIKEKIFEEGFSTKGSSGLGLYIAKKIVEMYGGELRVSDNEPSGAVFEIRIPLAKVD